MPFTDAPLTGANLVGDWLAVTNRTTAFLEGNTCLINEVTNGNLTINGVSVLKGNVTCNSNVHIVGNLVVDGTFPLTIPGGSNTNIQFNNSGAFGGNNSLTWNGSAFFVNGALIVNCTTGSTSFSGNVNFSSANVTGLSGAGAVTRADITLTHAQILALWSNSFLLVSAPSANQHLEIVSASLTLMIPDGAYTVTPNSAGAAGLKVTYGSNTSNWATSAIFNDPTVQDDGGNGNTITTLTDFFTGSGGANGSYAKLIPAGYTDSFNTSFGLNAYTFPIDAIRALGFFLTMDDATGISGGGANNTLKVSLLYYTI